MVHSNPNPRRSPGILADRKVYISLSLFFIGCGDLFESNPGGASQTSGIIYASAGSYADSALLRFIPFDAVALPGSVITVDSIRTDAMGCYSVTALRDGIYNAFGEKNGESFFRAGIRVKDGSAEHDTLRDTLGPPGSLFVFIRHRYHSDGGCIRGLLPGTGRYLLPEDSTGAFALTGFARGTYRVRFVTTLLFYEPVDTVVTFIAGKNDTLADTIYLEYGGIPHVAGFTATYDNRANIVHVSWNRMDTMLSPGYLVYKSETGQPPAPLTESPVADTFYADSNPALWTVFEYRVAGFENGKSGPLSGAEIVWTIFKPEGWHKGQLHCHTAGSDGALPVQRVLRMYREAGYDFVAVSDHNMVTQTDQYGDAGFITIPNDEFSYGIKHVNAINAVRHFPGSIFDPGRLQDVIDAALSVDAISQINHPQYSQHSAADIFNSTGAFLREIVNFRHDDPAYNAALWDSVLSMGKRIFGTAGDDAHNYISDFNKGWIMVQAPSFTKSGILSAIEAGDFYASSGPVITTIVTEGRVLGIESVDGVTVDFIGKNGKTLASVTAKSASYTLPAGEPYVRAEVRNARGNVAYTQAYFPKAENMPVVH